MSMKNLPIIIGIALPIVFLVVLALFIYIPSQSLNPQHNFIYTLDDNYYYRYSNFANYYQVVDGRIALVQNPNREDLENLPEKPPLYLYNFSDQTSKEISFEEARDYTLDPGPSSPDGYVVDYDRGHNGIFELFGSGSSRDGLYVSKGGASKNLEGFSTAGRYYGNFRLIGWIK